MRKLYKYLLVSVLIISILIPILIVSLFSINQSNIENINVELEFNSDNALKYVQDQLTINTTNCRTPGTQGREDCARYFVNQFQLIDSEIEYVLHNFSIHSIECQNVLFKINMQHENIVILGAHYDSRAKATKDNLFPNLPVPGANDGASGCAVLIELARIFYLIKHQLNAQIWFLFFDAEDQGYDLSPGMEGWDWCEGSTKFVEQIADFYDQSRESFDFMLLLDMVGTPNLQFISEMYSTSWLLNELFEVGRELGYTKAFPDFPVSSSILDDHKAFLDHGIPAADLIVNFWNNPDWPYHHTIGDDFSHISKESLKITGQTVEQFVYNRYLITNQL